MWMKILNLYQRRQQQGRQRLAESNIPSSAGLLQMDILLFWTLYPLPSCKPASLNIHRHTTSIVSKNCNGFSKKQAFRTSNLMLTCFGTNSRRSMHTWITRKQVGVLGW